MTVAFETWFAYAPERVLHVFAFGIEIARVISAGTFVTLFWNRPIDIT